LTDKRLRINKISFFVHFPQLLIGENAKPWFPVHDCEFRCSIEDRDDRLVIVNRGNELRGLEPLEKFPLEQFRSACTAIGTAPTAITCGRYKAGKHYRGLLLAPLYQINSIDRVNQRIGSRPDQRWSKLRQRRGR